MIQVRKKRRPVTFTDGQHKVIIDSVAKLKNGVGMKFIQGEKTASISITSDDWMEKISMIGYIAGLRYEFELKDLVGTKVNILVEYSQVRKIKPWN